MLFGQYQFAVAGDAQAIFIVIMYDHDFIPRSKQFATAESAAFRMQIFRQQRSAVIRTI